MATFQRQFIAGKMNKSVDERLVPNGQYIDALNVRLGSSESSEIGAVENSKGNTKLTSLSYKGVPLSNSARCIGAFEDGAKETIYWFIHDSSFGVTSPTGKLDLLISFNVVNSTLVYHLISVSRGGTSPANTILNFNKKYLITGVNLVDGLLFWTDNYNPPRFININRNYSVPSGSPLVDYNGNPSLFDEALLVIKKPPHSAPSVELTLTSGGDENYLEERFISFAYRYEYQDDEYSATSQFSDAAFNTKAFSFGSDSYLNEGAINKYNTAIVTYNSGGPLVTAIDLLFKDSEGTVIKVVEKLKKSELGLADNTDYTFTFRNSKIFTILPQSELLRLYDNVPLLAKSQTLMGNRLMYGNYIENYNLVDVNGLPVRFEFETELISESIGFKLVTDRFASVGYSFGGSAVIPNSRLYIELDGFDLKAGSLITIDASFVHSLFSIGTSPTQTSEQTDIEWSYRLPQDFGSVYALATSVDFQEKVGLSTNIKPVYDPTEETSCDGFTLTDIINCNIPNTLDPDLSTSWTKYQSGITAGDQPVRIITTPGSNDIGFDVIAMRRVDDVTTPTVSSYEYFSWNSAEVIFQAISDTKSLHSNRDYETAIIYMDKFNRASTALVSPLNSEHASCALSDQKNYIQVTIPAQQRPPYWATKYKFAIKPNAEAYETIYTNVFFTDPLTNDTYFLLEGENQRKVENGDRYIVKTDSQGPLTRCAYATVLEKEAQESGFIVPLDSQGGDVSVPAGTYMKMKAQNFSTALGDNPFIGRGLRRTEESESGSYPVLIYGGFGEFDDGTGSAYTPYTIPSGSRIKMTFFFERRGRSGRCEKRKYTLETTLTSSNNYDDIISWWEGDNVESILDTGIEDIGDGCSIENEYLPIINSSADNYSIDPELCINKYRWFKEIGNVPNVGEIRFIVSGTRACGGGKKGKSSVTVNFEIYRAESTIVFETIPTDTLPDVWYEGSEAFDIVREGCLFDLSVDTAEPNPIAFEYTLDGIQQQVVVNPDENIQNINGDCGSMVISPSTPPNNVSNVTIASTAVENVHLGNVQSQTLNQSAIIKTSFFNCFSFGNGVESYKIRDSIVGRPLLLGNRVTTTSSEDYRQADRFADITYSGIYNDESNVNKLNEFNLGLLNFKKLEESFGPIQKLLGRSTDVLTLQEDKISYVLAGKNLLSDSAVGGSIASVPEVLGTQIARLEEFGISFNPESFAVYGYDKYFSDQKRGVLIQLRGSAYSNEQLTVISEAGMRSWFRDRFIESPNTQKLGGYDPYMNEYAFSLNDESLPVDDLCIKCGVIQEVTYNASPLEFCFDVGQLVGTVDVNVVVNTAGQDIDLKIIYNNVSTSYALVNGSNNFSFNKNQVLVDTAQLEFSGSGVSQIQFEVSCPNADEIEIIQVCVSDDVDASQFIHNQYRWTDGTFVSPLHQEQVQLVSSSSQPIVSQYSSVLGLQGAGVIPANGAIVTIISRKISPTDDFVFANPPMNFKYLRTSTLYANTSAAIQNLLNASAQLSVNAPPSLPSTYQSYFIMPNSAGRYLYLIYDYREPVLAELCFSTLSNIDSCCGCNQKSTWDITQCREDGVVVTKIIGGAYSVGQFVRTSEGVFEITAASTSPETTKVLDILTVSNCNEVCQEYNLAYSGGEISSDVTYVDCDGITDTITILSGGSVLVCLKELVSSTEPISISLINTECTETNTSINLERCVIDWSTGGSNAEVATNDGLYQVGDLVTIDTDTSCVYRVISFGELDVTTAITSLSSLTSCDEVCNFYGVTNTTGSPATFVYTNCSGGEESIVFAANESRKACAKVASNQAGFTLVWTGCDCST